MHHYKRDWHAHNNYNNDMYMYSQNHFVEVFDEQAPFCLCQSVVLWNIGGGSQELSKHVPIRYATCMQCMYVHVVNIAEGYYFVRFIR